MPEHTFVIVQTQLSMQHITVCAVPDPLRNDSVLAKQ